MLVNTMLKTFYTSFSKMYRIAIYLFIIFIFLNQSSASGCGRNLTASWTELVLTSSNYPGKYDHNLDCTWEISASNGANVFLTIMDLDTEGCCDYLEVYDGPLKIAHLNGRSTTNIPLISSTSILFLRFVSDRGVARTGFRASYKEVSNCGHFLPATEQVENFSTPYFPMVHPQNINCFWSLFAIRQYQQVEVVIEEVGLDSCCDFIDIFDGPHQLKRIKGNLTGNRKFYSTTNRLGIYFQSMGSPTSRGFLASYREFQCGGTYSPTGDSIHELTSPNYPRSAAHDMDCRYNITAEPGYQIELTLEVDTEECCDYLDLYEGQKYLGKLQGNGLKSSVVSLGRSLNLYFHTDGNIHSKGFKGVYRQILPACGKSLSASLSPQTLISPGYPNPYPNNFKCNWVITAPSNKQIALRMNFVSTEACCDYIEVFDGVLGVGKFQGTIKTPTTVVSRTSRLMLQFYSDGSTRMKGFTSTYKLANNCGSSLYAVHSEVRNFTTPQYPNDYPNNMDCMWVIRSKDHTSVELNILPGETESKFDYVQVLDGLQSIAKLAGLWRTKQRFVSSSNTLRVYFHSDQRSTRNGFVAAYREICQYEYNVTSESVNYLTSPNYPNHSPHEYNCTYILTAPPGRRVILRSLSVDTEAELDHIKIYDGPRLLDVLSGTIRTTRTFTSTSSEMKIRYITDSTKASIGFRFTYQLG